MMENNFNSFTKADLMVMIVYYSNNIKAIDEVVLQSIQGCKKDAMVAFIEKHKMRQSAGAVQALFLSQTSRGQLKKQVKEEQKENADAVLNAEDLYVYLFSIPSPSILFASVVELERIK